MTEDIICQYPGMEHVDELRSYEYDGLGRVKKMAVRERQTGSGAETVYTYDKAGNMLSETEGNVIKNMTYNSLNQMTSLKSTRGGQTESECTYAYDARGNLIRETDTAQGILTSLEYDIRNQMEKRSVTVNGQSSAAQESRYNGIGQRVQKKENGEVVNYYYQGTTVYAVTDGMDALNSLHMLKGGEQCAGVAVLPGGIFWEVCMTVRQGYTT